MLVFTGVLFVLVFTGDLFVLVFTGDLFVLVFTGDLLVLVFTGDLFVLVFSVDSAQSWDEVLRLRQQLLETKRCALGSAGDNKRGADPCVPMVIAGNKCDMENR